MQWSRSALQSLMLYIIRSFAFSSLYFSMPIRSNVVGKNPRSAGRAKNARCLIYAALAKE